MQKLLSFVCICIGLCVSAVYAATSNSGLRGSKVFRIFPNDADQVNYLRSLQRERKSLNFLTDPGPVGSRLEVVVKPEDQVAFEDGLISKGIDSTVGVDDIHKLIETESKANQRSSAKFRALGTVFQLDKYNSYDEIFDFLSDLVKNNPSITKWRSIGLSYEGRQIMAIKIGKSHGKRKPAVLIDGGIHAREWIAIATAVNIANKLVTEYSTDHSIRKLLDELDIYIIPIVNPDGYEYSRKGPQERLWRNTRSPSDCRMTFNGYKCCYGVNLNRNFDWHFGGVGSTDDTCSDNYRGKSAFSEPESRALRDFILARKHLLGAYITLHAYGQAWLVPFGHTDSGPELFPEDFSELLELAQAGAQALAKVRRTNYTVSNTGSVSGYAAAGGSDDWAKGVAGIKYVYTIELSPNDDNSAGFILDPRFIAPVSSEAYEGIRVVAERVSLSFQIQ